MIRTKKHDHTWGNKYSMPLNHRYMPWEFMLRIDEVNYDVQREIHLITKGHIPLINLASGVNFVNPPMGLLEEANRALSFSAFYQDYDGYTGHAVGRRAVQLFEKIRSKQNTPITDENVMITCGAGAAIHLLSLYFGDVFKDKDVLVPVPTFPLVAGAMKAASLHIQEVAHAGNNRFLPTIDEIQSSIAEKTRLIYINMFNNPTGEYYTCQELSALVSLCKARGIFILLDRVSSDLDVTGDLPNILDIAVEHNYLDGIVVVSSLSKDRALPGLRVGWIIGSASIIEQLAYYNSFIAMSSPTLGSAVLYVDMLCRAILHAGLEEHVIKTITQLFYERVIPLTALNTQLREFLDPLQNVERVKILLDQYRQWRQHLEQLLRRNWEILREEYESVFIGALEWKGDFNTFVHIPELDGLPIYETAIEMFEKHGLQMLPGPVFGFDLSYWQTLGFWTRLSFALPTPQWRLGLATIAKFAADKKRATRLGYLPG